MAEKDLPERLQLQNERIQEIENKIKKLEDKEQDGKYLVSLKEKLVTEEKAKGDIENIYSLSAIEIAEIKAKAKQLALIAYRSGEYDLYKDYELVATTNEQGLLEVTDEYREELEGLIPAQYLELKEIEPEELEERSKEEDKTDLKKEEEKEEQKETVNKMQEDTGLELVSLVRIEDENFSRDVVGRETGYAEQYMGITKEGTICLLGLRPDNKFELNPDFVGARTARTDEQPGECGKSSVDMVVPRKDGTTSSLGIDINYGQISLTNRNTNEPIQTSNYRPSDAESEKYKLEEEKGNKESLERKMEEERKREEQRKKEKQEKEDDDVHGWPEERKSPWE